MGNNKIAIIPARMGSSRFPGKPLADILGKAMIHHVYARCQMAESLKEVYIATCDKEIMDYCNDHDLKCVMTRDDHERCTDRTAEALLKIEEMTGEKVDILVMVQGDEPMVFPQMIEESLSPFEDSEVLVSNLAAPLKSDEEREDPNEVKVVFDQKQNALYFSREPIPSKKKTNDSFTTWKQVCIIPFKRDFLLEFNDMKPTPLEEIESVDMMRILEHGKQVKIIPTSFDTYSVDTKEDLEKVIELMKSDSLISKYN